MKRLARVVAGIGLTVALSGAAALAADLAPAGAQTATAPRTEMWTVEVGGDVRTLPHYQGSEVYGVYFVPFLDVRAAGTAPRFHAPRDGIGYALYDTDVLKVGPVAQLELGRHVRHDPSLRGLGNVGPTAEVGGFVDYWAAPWLRARVELRQGIGGHHGIVSDETLDFVVPVTPQWTVSGGPRMTLATKDANAPYFSVTPAQSEASSLPVYDAGGGIRSIGAGTQAVYRWSPQWSSYGFLEYSRLTSGVGNSPIVTQRGAPDQAMIGVGAIYSFDMHALW